jgi:hypothetical protein
MTQTETWQVDFAVVQAQCNSGQQQCSSGTDLDYCDRYGTFVTYPCNGTCSGTTCDTPTGEICPDAIDVTMSGQITGDFTGVAADYSPSTTACTNWSANGPDLAYRVVLAQGQTVAATLSGTGDTSLYIVSDCGDIDGTCLDGDDSFGVPESVSYTSANGEVVYIIADNYDTGASAAGPFTLDITIQ